MPEPTTAAVAAATATVAAPVLVLAGIPLGLHAPTLIAGLVGAAAAILFFDAVPSTGDTLREVVRNTLRRLLFVVISAGLAGYAAPVVARVAGAMLPGGGGGGELELLAAAVVGLGAQKLFAAVINRGVKVAEGGA